MSDVIEKMARAIWAAQSDRPDRDGVWKEIWRAPEVRHPYEMAARAALGALAESESDAMIDAAWEAFRAPPTGMHVTGEPSYTKGKLARAIRAAILAGKG